MLQMRVNRVFFLERGGKVVLQSHRNYQVAHDRSGLSLLSCCLLALTSTIEWFFVPVAHFWRVDAVFQILINAAPREQELVYR
jgi:hypothetical protein